MSSAPPPQAARSRNAGSAEGCPRRVPALRFGLAALALAAAATPAPAQDRGRDRGAQRHRDVAAEIERRTSKLYREQGPAVASVRVVTRAAIGPRLVLPGVTIAPPGGRSERIDASCFVATSDGYVVTTSSALYDAVHIEVRFYDGTVRDADLVGTDGPFQIAVLRTRAPDDVQPLCVPDRAGASQPSPGWFFQADRGRPQVQYARVQSAEAKATSYDRYLASPLALRPGAAGGPLISADGRLMGVAVREVRHRADTRAPDRRTTDADAVPTLPPGPSTLFVRGADVHLAVEQIVRHGRVRRPLLGVVMSDDTNRIDQLLPGGPAHLAGLAEGDRVVRIANTKVTSLADITRALLRRTIGETVQVEIARGKESLRRPVELADLVLPPPPQVAPMPGAELQVARVPGTSGDWTVTIVDLVEGSSMHLAGAQIGDRLVRVDGRDALRFLQRHRIRPADAVPRRIEIERDQTRHELTLGE